MAELLPTPSTATRVVADAPTGAPILALRGIRKSYPGVIALDGVDFDVRQGEVHGLVGENGAGKSTLLKIIGAVERADAGTIELDGRPIQLASPHAAQAAGIRVIHQEFNLFPALSVAENIAIDHLPSRHGVVDRRAVRDLARSARDRLGVALPLETRVDRLGVADQQLTEIARALSADARLLVMDEPTAALTEHEIDALFRIVRSLRDEGVGVIFVSHRMEEVLALSDRVTVLRDGRVVGETARPTREQIIRLMVGRDVSELYPDTSADIGGPALELDGLSVAGRFEDLSFTVRRGEVVGLAGVIGAGRTSVGLALFGLLRPTSGQVRLDGKPIEPRTAHEAVKLGIGYVPEDRKALGLVLALSLRHNETHPILPWLSRLGWIDKRRERLTVEERVAQLEIKASSIDARVSNLSGGNQQKVLLAKWLEIKPRVLILDEPTRGVDIGAKAEIYQIVADLAKSGVAILLISSDLPELLGLSDRVVVLREGRQLATLDRADAGQEHVLSLVTTGAAA
ncbi:MAG TPA: sugar ABC transporter ATP-binding protein [Candidatus Limnocylindrales bacterium]